MKNGNEECSPATPELQRGDENENEEEEEDKERDDSYRTKVVSPFGVARSDLRRYSLAATHPNVMLTSRDAAQWFSLAKTLIILGLLSPGFSVPSRAAPATNAVVLLVSEGTVEVARAGQSVWDLASTRLPYARLNAGDQIRTKARSRATVRLSDLTLVELGPNSHFELLPIEERRGGFNLWRGLLYLFHRDKPGEFYFRTPTASPVIRGTEFSLEVADSGATTFHLLQGEVELTNEFGGLLLHSGEAARVEPARAPARTAALTTAQVIQWCLYYPAVLHVEELALSPDEKSVLGDSLRAYRQGDLLEALAAYPSGRQPGSPQENIYLAGLLLSVGDVTSAEQLLNSVSGPDARTLRLAAALKTLIAAVKFEEMADPVARSGTNELASSLVAASYYYQSRYELRNALASARAAVEQAPDFAFGWVRLAELEFGFGRTARAKEAVEQAIRLAPRNAQALSVRGFLLASANRVREAREQFTDALEVDGNLGNAWLGRGLCHLRLGATQAGLEDLLVAAALEPNRALLRSYLGKAFAAAGKTGEATAEFAAAKWLDPGDPTAWLYSALFHQQYNRINDAVRDLETSELLNDNRQLFRSRLLLDQDRAVRQANLASVYQDAGLFDDSVREAARATSSDYANASAHLFLANSYSQSSERNLINLRYETTAASEYLVAQLLAPVGGNALSPYVSQQEYSKLFEREGLGLSSSTEYLSRGDWRQRGVQYGVFGNFDYALDFYFASQNGQRPNNDYKLFSLAVPARFQLSPQDTVFLELVRTKFESGDLRQTFYWTNFKDSLRVEETQEPNAFAGYHHQWSPGSHSLLLLGRLQDDFQLKADDVVIPTFRRDFDGILGVLGDSFSNFNERLHSEFVAYSAEIQQLWQQERNTLIVGGRYQQGETETTATLDYVGQPGPGFVFPVGTQRVETDLQRAVIYAYDHWRVLDRLWLIGGLSYDWISYPQNIDSPPITDKQLDKDLISPKAGAVFLPTSNTVLRAAYTRSLGGLYYDNSVRLEPSQVAGFNQAFRSIIPESVAGLVPGAEFETLGLDFSWRFVTQTYFGVGLEWLQSEGKQNLGAFDSPVGPFPITVTNSLNRVDYEERSLTVNLNQLVGTDWAIGIRYRVSNAEFRARRVEVPLSLLGDIPYALVRDEATLHQFDGSIRYFHPSGFFAHFQSLWYAQDNRNLPDPNFWQFNLFAGYRFAGRRAEMLVGVLNLADQDYELNPLNLHGDLPRERTLLLSLKFNF